MKDWFRRYLFPGFILKSVIIGGGYASGQEFLQYFLVHGPWGGLIAIFCATLGLGAVYGVSLEFARIGGSYEYKGFFKRLLGPFWILFELAYVFMLFLILSNIGAVFGNTLHNELDWPVLAGELGFSGMVAFIVLFGTAVIERFLVAWSFVLYGFYFTFVLLCLVKFGPLSLEHFSADRLENPLTAAFGGLTYAGYNIAGITATLFVATRMKSPGESIVGGLTGGVLAMLPAGLFFIAMVAFYPDILNGVVPMTLLLDRLELPAFQILFLVVLMSALLGTGAALVHSVNERIAEARRQAGRPMPYWFRAVVALLVLTFSCAAADRIGLVDLVKNGYGMMAKVFILLFMIPILTIGVWKIVLFYKESRRAPADRLEDPWRQGDPGRPA